MNQSTATENRSGRGRGGRGRGRRGGGRGNGRGRGRRSVDSDATPETTRTTQSNGGPRHQGGRSGRTNNLSGGRKNGRGRFGGRQSTSRSLPEKPEMPILKNGEKGAEAFTVSEAIRIGFTKQLMEFREKSEVQSLEFPSTLTNTERKFLHQLASNLGLKSKSTGKGENRHITVTKRNDQQTTVADQVPRIAIGQVGLQALKNHVKLHPPTHAEELESHETGASLLEAFQKAGEDGENDNFSSTLRGLGLTDNTVASTHQHRASYVDIGKRRDFHARAQEQKRRHHMFHAMMEQRARLPAYQHEKEIVHAINKHRITVISGEAGSGKSTQCPQFLLDAIPEANIVVTQPRRISTISLAERVAQEQCQEKVGPWIGYQVRLDAALKRDTTQLAFVTPGILLRQLQSSSLLEQYTHIIIDEIHERDKYTEFLLATLCDLLPRRPDLRFVFMSATLQLETLLSYWQEQNDEPIAHVQIQGRTFPVQDFYLENILRMTGYLDQTSGSPLAEGELEAELAALTGGKSLLDLDDNQKDSVKLGNSTLKCVLCGRNNFVDALALAEHLPLCDGEFQEEAAAKSSGAAQFVSGDDSSTSSDENNHSKWDGVSTFEVPDKVVGGKDTELLDQYQVMHNDDELDYTLMVEVLRLIVENSESSSAILVFLPGWGEISEFGMLLESTPPFQDESKYLILPLHSGIPSQDQRLVLQLPPNGMRKIVLSTNIAETSITIEDIAFVVDTGKAKEKSYDPHLKTSTLQPAWISRASAKQRRGRAGRTKAGVAFHLFSKTRYKSMRPFLESELLRTPLEEMCLLCKKLGLAPGGIEDDDGVPSFLAKAMSPPHPKSVTNALELLVDLGAMEPVTNNLTTLGRCLSTISLEPRVAKMVIWSHLLGCSRAAVDMAVCMSYKSPFVMPPPHLRRAADNCKVELSQGSESDQIALMHILRQRDQFLKGRGVGGGYYAFCRKNFLSASTLDMISDMRSSLNRELQYLKFPQSSAMNQYHNRHNKDDALWQAAIAAGLYPNLACRSSSQTNFTTISSMRQKAKIHNSSVNSVKGQPLSGKSTIPDGELDFVAFGELVMGPQVLTMSQTTHLSSALPLLLLCGTSLSVFPKNDEICLLNLDDVAVFECPSETAANIVLLRKRLESGFWRYIDDPSVGLHGLNPAERHALDIVGTVLRSAHQTARK